MPKYIYSTLIILSIDIFESVIIFLLITILPPLFTLYVGGINFDFTIIQVVTLMVIFFSAICDILLTCLTLIIRDPELESPHLVKIPRITTLTRPLISVYIISLISFEYIIHFSRLYTPNLSTESLIDYSTQSLRSLASGTTTPIYNFNIYILLLTIFSCFALLIAYYLIFAIKILIRPHFQNINLVKKHKEYVSESIYLSNKDIESKTKSTIEMILYFIAAFVLNSSNMDLSPAIKPDNLPPLKDPISATVVLTPPIVSLLLWHLWKPVSYRNSGVTTKALTLSSEEQKNYLTLKYMKFIFPLSLIICNFSYFHGLNPSKTPILLISYPTILLPIFLSLIINRLYISLIKKRYTEDESGRLIYNSLADFLTILPISFLLIPIATLIQSLSLIKRMKG